MGWGGGGGGNAFVFSFCLLSFCFIYMYSDRMLKWGGGVAFFLHLFVSLPPVLLQVSHVFAFCRFCGGVFSKG